MFDVYSFDIIAHNYILKLLTSQSHHLNVKQIYIATLRVYDICFEVGTIRHMVYNNIIYKQQVSRWLITTNHDKRLVYIRV